MSKKIVLRIVLGVLIALWLGFIWCNSAENGSETVETSNGVTQIVAEIVVPGYGGLPQEEKTAVIEKISPPVRSLAHAFEFFVLALLVGSLVYTFAFKGLFLRQVLIASGACVLCACADEIHQYFVPGRTADILDILVDVAGALVGCGILIAAALLRNNKVKKAV